VRAVDLADGAIPAVCEKQVPVRIDREVSRRSEPRTPGRRGQVKSARAAMPPLPEKPWLPVPPTIHSCPWGSIRKIEESWQSTP
jgi:hypothetical protein